MLRCIFESARCWVVLCKYPSLLVSSARNRAHVAIQTASVSDT